jgi:hypothetical protein
MKDSVRISIYHHATLAWLAWQAAEEDGDSRRAEKAFRVYDFGFDLIGRRRPDASTMPALTESEAEAVRSTPSLLGRLSSLRERRLS